MAAFPGKDKAEVGLGSRLASSLGPPPFSIFGLGWRRLVYFMQNVMANEVATSWPGKTGKGNEGKGRARLTDRWSICGSVFSSVFQLPGSTPSGKYLNL